MNPQKCPKCRKQLQEMGYFKVRVDECTQCLGLWFDATELDQIKSELDESIRWIDVDLWRYAERSNFNASIFDCPKCQTLMSELRFSDSGILLEFCINCGGAWLDQGEHHALIRFIRERSSAHTLEELKKISLQQFKEIFTGRKGVSEETKDFLAAWRMLSLRFAVEHPALVQKLQQIRHSLPF
jgi:uncharacterized protein